MAETTVAIVYGALPGTIAEICEKTGLDRKKVTKTIGNMNQRRQVKGAGKPRSHDRVWSMLKGGNTPTHSIHRNAPVKRKYKKRKKVKRIGFLMQFDIINKRLGTIEDVLGIE